MAGQQTGREFFLHRYGQLGGTVTDVALRPALRVNTLATTAARLQERLAAKGVTLVRIPFLADGFWYESPKFSLGATTEYLRGQYFLQEAASQLPVQALAPKPGETVLDMAAAPGGKTTQIAAALRNQGALIAIEKSNLRIHALKSHLDRCKVLNALVYNTDAAKAAEFGIPFDRVLLDAPCSGNYATSKDWFGQHGLFDIRALADIQRRLLGAGTASLAKGGTLVYSVCSLEPEECELIIDWALRELPVALEPVDIPIGRPGCTEVFSQQLHPTLARTRRLWPHETGTQGFYIAKLRKVV
jgi:NOL1/NOP2/sun family putative RNA methylase